MSTFLIVSLILGQCQCQQIPLQPQPSKSYILSQPIQAPVRIFHPYQTQSRTRPRNPSSQEVYTPLVSPSSTTSPTSSEKRPGASSTSSNGTSGDSSDPNQFDAVEFPFPTISSRKHVTYRVLIFKAVWCGPCKIVQADLDYLTRHTWSSTDNPLLTPDHHFVVIDEAQHPDLVAQFQVSSYPTIIQLRRAGERLVEGKRYVGYQQQPLAKTLTDLFR